MNLETFIIIVCVVIIVLFYIRQYNRQSIKDKQRKRDNFRKTLSDPETKKALQEMYKKGFIEVTDTESEKLLLED